jgi:hypothetical protein
LNEAGNEYWLQYDLSPSKSSVVYIDTSTDDGTYIIDGTLKYSTEEKIPRKDFRCDPNATIDSFTQCAFNELQDFECSSAIVRIGKYFNETNICKNLTMLHENHKLHKVHLATILYSSKNPSKCIRPCKTSSFDVSMRKRHENDQLLLPSQFQQLFAGKFYINFKSADFTIETKNEYFVINQDGLISAVGGFLGLFLGSSLVSVIEWIGRLFKCSK